VAVNRSQMDSDDVCEGGRLLWCELDLELCGGRFVALSFALLLSDAGRKETRIDWGWIQNWLFVFVE